MIRPQVRGLPVHIRRLFGRYGSGRFVMPGQAIRIHIRPIFGDYYRDP
jgi:hypothetical protein